MTNATEKSENFTVRETAKIDGGAYRWVEFADGSARVEGWGPNGWTPGGATFWEFLETPPVSPRFAAELGIPMSDIRVVRRPTTKSPCENLTAKRLREAIDLGVKLAEESALRRLTLKAKHVRELDLNRRGPRLVWDRDRGIIE